MGTSTPVTNLHPSDASQDTASATSETWTLRPMGCVALRWGQCGKETATHLGDETALVDAGDLGQVLVDARQHVRVADRGCVAVGGDAVRRELLRHRRVDTGDGVFPVVSLGPGALSLLPPATVSPPGTARTPQVTLPLRPEKPQLQGPRPPPGGAREAATEGEITTLSFSAAWRAEAPGAHGDWECEDELTGVRRL